MRTSLHKEGRKFRADIFDPDTNRDKIVRDKAHNIRAISITPTLRSGLNRKPHTRALALTKNHFQMKKIVVSAMVLIIIITCVSCNNSSTDSEKIGTTDSTQFHALDTTKLTKGATFYQCEMNPEITSDKPGTCPVCGMDLDKVEKK